eukprot:TRINITY_DN17526_c1_g1_i1.p1 TRINITY_DN17526_c1_g1~~TRINITY_DN17526_c1_g1_i1.p1  ORF type:complete len:715 (-),score=41.93 TRINITY_DN17526_c1_g1_i1:492-2600(-)
MAGPGVVCATVVSCCVVVLAFVCGYIADVAIDRGVIAGVFEFLWTFGVFHRIWRPLEVLEKKLDSRGFQGPSIWNISHRPSDVWVVTWPKSGTTWVTHMAHQLRVRGRDVDFQDQDDVVPWAEMVDTGYLAGTRYHNHLDAEHVANPRVFKSHLKPSKLPAGNYKKVIVLRHPADVLVSVSKFLPTLWGIHPSPTVSEMCSFLLYSGDVERMAQFYVDVWNQRAGENVLLLFYEDLQEDPGRWVTRLASFMEVPADPDLIARVVNQTSHATMSSQHLAFANLAQTANVYKAQGLHVEASRLVGKVRRDGGRSGDGGQLSAAYIDALKRVWHRVVYSATGFPDYETLREARHREGAEASSARALPRVNVSSLLGSDSIQSRSVRLQLWDAAQRWGAVRIVGHNVDVGKIKSSGRRYFDVSRELRNVSFRNHSSGFQRGAIPFAGEAGVADTLEAKEGFVYGYEWSQESTYDNSLQGPNVWPPENVVGGAGWRTSLLDHYNQSVSLARSLVQAILMVLHPESPEQAAKDAASLCDGGETISLLRLFNYFRSDYRPEVRPGMPRTGSGAHTDWYLLTIILRDANSRLQIVPRGESEWVDVNGGIDDELVVLFGDFFSLYTEGKTHSPVHRVLLPVGSENSLSFVFLYSPSYAAPMPATPVAPIKPTIPGVKRINTLLDQADDSIWGKPFGQYIQKKRSAVMKNLR